MRPVLRRLAGALAEVDGLGRAVEPRVLAVSRYTASKLLLLLPRRGHPEQLDLLMTRRAAGLRRYPGQPAFPGGRVEAEDGGPVAAALREAEEEVGLRREEVTVLGVFPPLFNDHGGLNYCTVAFLDDPSPVWTGVVDRDEVESCHRLPLERFLSASGVTRKPWTTLVPSNDARALTIEVACTGLDGRQLHVWGGTAVYAIATAMLAFGRMPAFPDFFLYPGVRPEADSVRSMLQGMNTVFVDLCAIKAKL